MSRRKEAENNWLCERKLKKEGGKLEAWINGGKVGPSVP